MAGEVKTKLSKNLLRMKACSFRGCSSPTRPARGDFRELPPNTGLLKRWREFMQRGLDSQTKKQLEEEEKKIISEEHWYLDLPDLKEKESFVIEERSFMPCEDLLYGRMSFKGFNPEIEKLMIQMNSRCKEEEIEVDDKMEADVSDEEMARRYETLVGTIGKKFLRKRDQRVLQDEDEDGSSNTRPSKKAKKKFLKPQE
ncbi:PREDICTED: M-phase phosphoprotein 6 isoform X1 [Haliaeetus leucocephalus]|nr:PREDICTED: M-phase phosphoprotein 6 isoform X1 [Haliaeetus leucocephalus]